MRHIIRLAAVSCLLAMAGAQAQDLYAEGLYYHSKVSGTGYDTDPHPRGLIGIIGLGLAPHLAIEGVFGGSAQRDSVTDTSSGAPVNIATKTHKTYGVYLKPRYQVSDKLELFARAGYLRTRLCLDAAGTVPGQAVSVRDSDTRGSLAWGLGANYAITPHMYLSGSYAQTHKRDGIRISGFNVGLGYRF